MYVEKKHTQRLPHWIKDADGGKRHSTSPNTTTIKFDFHYLTCELYATDSSFDDETTHLCVSHALEMEIPFCHMVVDQSHLTCTL